MLLHSLVKRPVGEQEYKVEEEREKIKKRKNSEKRGGGRGCHGADPSKREKDEHCPRH